MAHIKNVQREADVIVPEAGETYVGLDGTVSKVLDDVVDPNYEPSREEIVEFAESIGMTLPDDEELLYIARNALKTPLPKEWKPCVTDSEEIYYFNFKTGDTRWEHPMDDVARRTYETEKQKQKRGEEALRSPGEGLAKKSPLQEAGEPMTTTTTKATAASSAATKKPSSASSSSCSGVASLNPTSQNTAAKTNGIGHSTNNSNTNASNKSAATGVGMKKLMPSTTTTTASDAVKTVTGASAKPSPILTSNGSFGKLAAGSGVVPSPTALLSSNHHHMTRTTPLARSSPTSPATTAGSSVEESRPTNSPSATAAGAKPSPAFSTVANKMSSNSNTGAGSLPKGSTTTAGAGGATASTNLNKNLTNGQNGNGSAGPVHPSAMGSLSTSATPGSDSASLPRTTKTQAPQSTSSRSTSHLHLSSSPSFAPLSSTANGSPATASPPFLSEAETQLEEQIRVEVAQEIQMKIDAHEKEVQEKLKTLRQGYNAKTKETRDQDTERRQRWQEEQKARRERELQEARQKLERLYADDFHSLERKAALLEQEIQRAKKTADRHGASDKIQREVAEREAAAALSERVRQLELDYSSEQQKRQSQLELRFVTKKRALEKESESALDTAREAAQKAGDDQLEKARQESEAKRRKLELEKKTMETQLQQLQSTSSRAPSRSPSHPKASGMSTSNSSPSSPETSALTKEEEEEAKATQKSSASTTSHIDAIVARINDRRDEEVAKLRAIAAKERATVKEGKQLEVEKLRYLIAQARKARATQEAAKKAAEEVAAMAQAAAATSHTSAKAAHAKLLQCEREARRKTWEEEVAAKMAALKKIREEKLRAVTDEAVRRTMAARKAAVEAATPSGSPSLREVEQVTKECEAALREKRALYKKLEDELCEQLAAELDAKEGENEAAQLEAAVAQEMSRYIADVLSRRERLQTEYEIQKERHEKQISHIRAEARRAAKERRQNEVESRVALELESRKRRQGEEADLQKQRDGEAARAALKKEEEEERMRIAEEMTEKESEALKAIRLRRDDARRQLEERRFHSTKDSGGGREASRAHEPLDPAVLDSESDLEKEAIAAETAYRQLVLQRAAHQGEEAITPTDKSNSTRTKTQLTSSNSGDRQPEKHSNPGAVATQRQLLSGQQPPFPYTFLPQKGSATDPKDPSQWWLLKELHWDHLQELESLYLQQKQLLLLEARRIKEQLLMANAVHNTGSGPRPAGEEGPQNHSFLLSASGHSVYYPHVQQQQQPHLNSSDHSSIERRSLGDSLNPPALSTTPTLPAPVARGAPQGTARGGGRGGVSDDDNDSRSTAKRTTSWAGGNRPPSTSSTTVPYQLPPPPPGSRSPTDAARAGSASPPSEVVKTEMTSATNRVSSNAHSNPPTSPTPNPVATPSPLRRAASASSLLSSDLEKTLALSAAAHPLPLPLSAMGPSSSFAASPHQSRGVAGSRASSGPLHSSTDSLHTGDAARFWHYQHFDASRRQDVLSEAKREWQRDVREYLSSVGIPPPPASNRCDPDTLGTTTRSAGSGHPLDVPHETHSPPPQARLSSSSYLTTPQWSQTTLNASFGPLRGSYLLSSGGGPLMDSGFVEEGEVYGNGARSGGPLGSRYSSGSRHANGTPYAVATSRASAGISAAANAATPLPPPPVAGLGFGHHSHHHPTTTTTGSGGAAEAEGRVALPAPPQAVLQTALLRLQQRLDVLTQRAHWLVAEQMRGVRGGGDGFLAHARGQECLPKHEPSARHPPRRHHPRRSSHKRPEERRERKRETATPHPVDRPAVPWGLSYSEPPYYCDPYVEAAAWRTARWASGGGKDGVLLRSFTEASTKRIRQKGSHANDDDTVARHRTWQRHQPLSSTVSRHHDAPLLSYDEAIQRTSDRLQQWRRHASDSRHRSASREKERPDARGAASSTPPLPRRPSTRATPPSPSALAVEDLPNATVLEYACPHPATREDSAQPVAGEGGAVVVEGRAADSAHAALVSSQRYPAAGEDIQAKWHQLLKGL